MVFVLDAIRHISRKSLSLWISRKLTYETFGLINVSIQSREEVLSYSNKGLDEEQYINNNPEYCVR